MEVINRLPKLIGIVILTGILLAIVVGFMADQIATLAPNIQFGGQSDRQATFFPKGEGYGGIQVNLNYQSQNDFVTGDEIKITVTVENRMNESADVYVALHDDGGDVETIWPSPDFTYTGPDDATDVMQYVADNAFPYPLIVFTVGPNGNLNYQGLNPALDPGNYEVVYNWKNLLEGEKWQVTRNTDWEATGRETFDEGFNVTVFHEEVGYVGHINTTDEDVEDAQGCYVCIDW